MAISVTEQSFTVTTSEKALSTGTTTLTEDDTDGIYQVDVFIASMAVADEFLLKIYGKLASGGTQFTMYEIPIKFGMSSPIQVCPRWSIHGFLATLTKISGTDRTATTSQKRVS